MTSCAPDPREADRVRAVAGTIELVDALEVHALRAPHRVVDHIESGVYDELVEVRGVLALHNRACRR